MYRHWFIDDLNPATVYKFKLVATGNKNIESSGRYVVNHGFVLINTVEEYDTIPDIPIDTIPPIIIPIDTIRVLDYQFKIIRVGRFQIYIGDSLLEGEHNEYEKAIEHGLKTKALNPTKDVTIKSPVRRIELE
ncbi:hypothetical protein LCGC14_1287220 [marine sediment metagenome]|uniref:Uncharacterized protein n=1 Tax=marine sediment metagenome TaxID=412755 RepID=A0A0F9KTH3_9ZZZZ